MYGDQNNLWNQLTETESEYLNEVLNLFPGAVLIMVEVNSN